MLTKNAVFITDFWWISFGKSEGYNRIIDPPTQMEVVMAAIETYSVSATPNSDRYEMYLLQVETSWERAAVAALAKRGHDVELSQPVFIDGETYHCVCFRTVRSDIETMLDLVMEEAALLQPAEPEPA